MLMVSVKIVPMELLMIVCWCPLCSFPYHANNLVGPVLQCQVLPFAQILDLFLFQTD